MHVHIISSYFFIISRTLRHMFHILFFHSLHFNSVHIETRIHTYYTYCSAENTYTTLITDITHCMEKVDTWLLILNMLMYSVSQHNHPPPPAVFHVL